MKFFSVIKKSLIFLMALTYGGCAQFGTVDRSEVNKPAMDLDSPMVAGNQATLTQQKSSNSLSIGSCSVCAH